jgi:hypothetical protein
MRRPQLAPYIVAISTHWNELQMRISLFCAGLIAANSSAALQEYLLRQNSRTNEVDAIVAEKLSPDDFTVFQKIQKNIGARSGEHGKAAHGIWGVSDDYPDDLLWYDPREIGPIFPEFIDRKTSARQVLSKAQADNIRIFTAQDFKDTIARFEHTLAKLEAFTKPFVMLALEQLGKEQ